MKTTTLIGGIGGIVFGVLMFVGLLVAAPPGGSYKASDLTSYVASGHRGVVLVALYLVIVAILGLICLLARLREEVSVGADEQPVALSIFWGTGLAAAVAFVIGWAVSVSVPVAYLFGGDGFSITPSETYAIVEAGDAILLGAGAILLGFALIALFISARTALPTWFGWVTLIAGILGLASPAFFPFFALLIWGLVAGIWLLATTRTTVTAPAT